MAARRCTVSFNHETIWISGIWDAVYNADKLLYILKFHDIIQIYFFLLDMLLQPLKYKKLNK